MLQSLFSPLDGCKITHLIDVQQQPSTHSIISELFWWQGNLAHSEVYSIQYYVIKFVSDLRKIGGFLPVLWFPPPIKLTAGYLHTKNK
jgi:hypothetical protein